MKRARTTKLLYVDVDRIVALAGLAIAIIIGVPQVYLAWQQVRLAREQQRHGASNQAKRPDREASPQAQATPPGEHPPAPQLQSPSNDTSPPVSEEPIPPASPSPKHVEDAKEPSDSAPYWVAGLQQAA